MIQITQRKRTLGFVAASISKRGQFYAVRAGEIMGQWFETEARARRWVRS